MWQLTTFGGLSLRTDSPPPVPAVAAQRRPLALLALLADAGVAGLSREKLLLYLWPESDEERARNALRQLLHSLRHGLGAPELLLGTTDLHLNPTLITADVGEFAAALDRRDPEGAAAVYRGPFLDGFHLPGSPEFDYWMDARRADYAARAASAIEAVARAASERGETEAALSWWRRGATLEPLNGRIALELMQALAVSGNAAGALQHARVYEALVREELGAPPDPTVVALAERLRQAPPVVTPLPTATPKPTTIPAPAGTAGVHGQPAAAPTAGNLPKLRERLQQSLGDRYQVERELPRRDGTARVFIARDQRHERSIAIKVLHPALSSSLDVERFRREIEVTARFQHPHIVPVLESGEVGEQPWFAAPHLEGEWLRDRLARQEALTLADAIAIAVDLAEALTYAHRQGVVHRDIKPENILVAEGHAFLTNFGLATALLSAAGSKLTGTGMLVGTPAYMSPEQARGQPVDTASDVYSLACVLYELVSGEPLHSGPTPQAILARRNARDTQPVDPSRGGIPASVADILSSAMVEDPQDRITAAELLRRLKQVPAETFEQPAQTPSAPVGPAGEVPAQEIAARASTRRQRWLTGGGIALIGLLVLGGLLCYGT